MTNVETIWRTQYRHPASWDCIFSPMTMPALFSDAVSRAGSAPFLDFLGRKFSYRQVFKTAQQAAQGLRALGIVKGDRVGLYLPNVPHYVAAYYGAMMIGATVVNFSPLYTVEELSAQVEDSGTRLLVTLDVTALLPNAMAVLARGKLERLVVGSVASVLPRMQSILYQIFKRSDRTKLPRDRRITTFSALIDNHGLTDFPDIDPDDVALLQYTGGTTGTPKGAMLTHQNLTAVARQVDSIDPKTSDGDRIVGVLPFFHVFANTCVLNRTIVAGGMIAMLPRFDAKATLKTIARVRATALPGVPTMFQALLDHPDSAATDFSSLRVCISGGAPLPGAVKVQFEKLTGSKVVEGYGLTESSGVLCCNPYEAENKTGTIGQPMPGTRIKLLNRDDASKDAVAGEPGEIAFSGPQTMKGYWKKPEADAEVFVGAWVRTGDVGTIDADGYVRIVDRIKDMIAVSGFKVFPSVVEAQLYKHPAVKEALVIGVPDRYAGERPKAFVTLNHGAQIDGASLMAWLNPLLGKHERVIAVELRDALPKTLVGKLSRKELVAEEIAKSH
jgi:long-chain acyl-CoA synthetase